MAKPKRINFNGGSPNGTPNRDFVMRHSVPRHISNLFCLLSLVLILTAPLIGCGKKGNPKPPESTAPTSVVSLTATGEISAIVLSWEAPDTNVNGDQLTDLAGFVVRRSPVLKDTDPEFETVAELTLEDVKGEGTPPRFSFKDTGVLPGKRYQYQVLAVNGDGTASSAGAGVRVTFKGESSVIEQL